MGHLIFPTYLFTKRYQPKKTLVGELHVCMTLFPANFSPKTIRLSLTEVAIRGKQSATTISYLGHVAFNIS